MPKFQVIYSTTRRAWDRLCNLRVAIMERLDDDFRQLQTKDPVLSWCSGCSSLGAAAAVAGDIMSGADAFRSVAGKCLKRPSLPRQFLTSPPTSPYVMMCGWSILWWFLNSSEGVLFFLVFFLSLFVVWIAFRITCNREKSSNKYWYFQLRCMQSWRSVEGARVGLGGRQRYSRQCHGIEHNTNYPASWSIFTLCADGKVGMRCLTTFSRCSPSLK
jgi:hypothetical protein